MGGAGIPSRVGRNDGGRGTSRDASGTAAVCAGIGRPGGSHGAPTGPAASCGGLGSQTPRDHSGCPGLGLGLHQLEKQGAPNAETQPELFYPLSTPGWMDQEDIAFQGMGYLDTDWICPTCLKTQADHEARDCRQACGTCHEHHPGHFCPKRYLSFNWYKKHGGRTPFVGEIKHFRPSEKDLETLRKKHAYFTNFRPVQSHNKRKREDEDPSETRKKLKSRETQVECLSKRFGRMKQEVKEAQQEASAAREQAKVTETENERLRHIISELQDRQGTLNPSRQHRDITHVEEDFGAETEGSRREDILVLPSKRT